MFSANNCINYYRTKAIAIKRRPPTIKIGLLLLRQEFVILNTGLRKAKKIKELYPLVLQSNPITVINNSYSKK
jgi:hypothetical protein